MTRLWDKGTSLDAQVLEYTAGDDHALDNRLVAYDIRASIAHAEMLGERKLLSPPDLEAIRTALTAIGAEHAQGKWRISLEQEDCQTAIENLLTARLGATGGRLHAGRSRNDQVLAALRLYMRDAAQALSAARSRWLTRCKSWPHGMRIKSFPATPTYNRPCRAASRSGRGIAAELKDDAEGLRLTQRRSGKNPLGSAAGFGTPNLDIDRESTRRHLGFAVVHEPVTAVQLSRGKAEAQLLFEITLLTQDLARLAADLLLFYTQEFSYVSLPQTFTTGSSIMPQKRNPDVFELMRGRSAVAQAALNEVLGITQKLTSGYQRDLQLIKPPLFRGIDSCTQTLAILPSALNGVCFRPEKIRLDPNIHAAAAANALVAKEGIPFREAYRRVAAKLKDNE